MSKKLTLIYLEWADAVSSGSGWTMKEDLDRWIDESEWIIKQCGWILHEDKKHITIVSQIKPEDAFTEAQHGHIQKIPQSWIRKRVNLNKHI